MYLFFCACMQRKLQTKRLWQYTLISLLNLNKRLLETRKEIENKKYIIARRLSNMLEQNPLYIIHAV
jgi:hypothetical protein